ncbi:GNAT family N-acetyltransferase [Nocardioides sp. zg-DK7169]|uniref:GNAT family N-acetyltransferase n=1 Tax=Nocardioides sp. zg-DK7169 TaxID=2736600 RepID=UPI00155383E8|nr:GNAT family N-acetyltransferase [Nocardioides sp. zg-DK7169]NPC95200.1 GNAT family N-acetyltransferase [Nocardioides sp. zg-DK7169]
MEILSCAWRTDLALLIASGSTVEHLDTHVVVRTPANPTFRWGNFVLLRRAPTRAELPRWAEIFDAAFPDAGHRAFGIDDPEADSHALTPLARAGYQVETCTVLTADEVHEPRHGNATAVLRRLEGDADWAARVELAIACSDPQEGPGFAEFAVRRAAAERRLADGGHGDWFGAFDGEQMLSGLGIFRTGDGLARFQSVETHPEHRRRGLAGSLVHHAGRHAFDNLGAHTLVIVADPDYPAIRIYRHVGFRPSETQLQAELHPRR